ncbi:MAG: endolytic transglycosylase MltG, partial [Coriobacteriia bacterium]|nr:endolytic transglycosylase MltG [Coriobacteriia bacterium]
ATPSRRRRALIFLPLGLVLVALILAAVAAWALLFRPDHEIPSGLPVQVEIPEGASTADIGDQLSAAGVVENANMFRLQSRLSNADADLRAGVYDLVTGMPYGVVITELTRGPKIKYVTVTIPEGFVVEQVAQRMEEQAGIPAEEFLALAKSGGAKEFPEHQYLEAGYQGSLEGYLFPKTYRIKEGTTAREAIEIMLDQFDVEIAAVDLTLSQEMGFDLHEVVTIASMIEREAQIAKEREIVSSVVYNRLKKDMRLEIDATIEYVLPGNRFRLRASDLEIDSPYNTYRKKGLPPGPIANPGLASLKAAAMPAQTDYIYYVLTGTDGSHTFATNENDFLEAKRKSKEVFGR